MLRSLSIALLQFFKDPRKASCTLNEEARSPHALCLLVQQSSCKATHHVSLGAEAKSSVHLVGAGSQLRQLTWLPLSGEAER